MNNSLKELLELINIHSQTGNRRDLRAALHSLMENRQDYYHQLSDATLTEGYADGLYKTLLLELDQEEEGFV